MNSVHIKRGAKIMLLFISCGWEGPSNTTHTCHLRQYYVSCSSHHGNTHVHMWLARHQSSHISITFTVDKPCAFFIARSEVGADETQRHTAKEKGNPYSTFVAWVTGMECRIIKKYINSDKDLWMVHVNIIGIDYVSLGIVILKALA